MRALCRGTFAVAAAIAITASRQSPTYAEPSPSAQTSHAMPPAMATPSPTAALKPSCPSVAVFSSRDGRSYVVMFSDRNVYSGGVAMKLYTRTETFAANFQIAIDLPTQRARFRSGPIALADPSSEPLDSADITYDGAEVPGGCVERFRVTPYSDASLDARTAYATLDPARPPITLSKVIGVASPLACTSPYADATVDGAPAQLEYPAMARELGLTGMTVVKVTLAADGAVTGASIYRSSGSTVLDQAAVKAAVATHYRPDIVRCEPERGSYLFRAEFSTAR